MLSGLYGITSERFLQQKQTKILEGIEASCCAGLSLLQYRQKSTSKISLATLQAMQNICTQYGTLFIINDDVDLALALNADGVHLGKGDNAIKKVRANTRTDFIIGASCYNSIALAKKAQLNGASYAAFGAMFPSITKPNAPTAKLQTLVDAKKQIQLPICAIGGINKNNMKLIVKTKVDMLAVVSEIFNQTDIYKATESLVALIKIKRYATNKKGQ